MRDFLQDAEGARTPDPQKAAQQAMRQQLPKRFYNNVTIGEEGEGHLVLLDGKPVRTPARNRLLMPTAAAAAVLAAEWEAQGERIDPATMPANRIANTALDGIGANTAAVAADIVAFAGNDLLCYRAGHPEGLTRNQHQEWDPLIEWAAGFGARFRVTGSVLHVAQDQGAIGAFAARLDLHASAMKLACIHTVTTLTGSAILALALAEGFLTPEAGWRAAHVDEDWNIAQWGEDHEASMRREFRLAEYRAALTLLGSL